MANIVVVDDEEDARELLASNLGRRGHSVRTARDGAEALAAIDRATDAVVTDLVMPRVDGIGLLEELAKRQLPLTKVVITSFADKDRAVAALNLGAHYLVEKPFSADQIAALLERIGGERAALTIEQVATRSLDGLGLSDRDRRLVVYVLKGLTNQDIARQLNVSEQSVKNYLHALYRRLGISSRGELFHLIFPL